MHPNVIDDPRAIEDLLARTHRIAVLGIKTEAQPEQPAFNVPRFLVESGYDVVPVPVYYPKVTTILGRPVYRKVADVPGPIDMVDVFRRPEDLMPHLEDLLAAKPASVWLQQGIHDDVFAERLAERGILVVQDRCIMTELRLRAALRRRALREDASR
ncbi:CoA-binding protein [Pendulispora albinea]|uniref:CoA-binding protein n=2 Tax=Pendulispora albinea TaxID=2741071 RepID=A0ABZ2MCI5_9BACT